MTTIGRHAVAIALLFVGLPTGRTALAAEPQSVTGLVETLDKYDEQRTRQFLDSAIATFTAAIRQDPNNAEAFRGRALAYWYRGNLDVPLDFVAQVSADFDQSIWYRGEFGQPLADLSQALVDFNRSIRINPRSAQAYIGRANVCCTLNYFRKAVSDCDMALRLAPGCATGYSARGYAHLRAKDYAKAIVDFGRAVAADPSDAVSYYNRANAREENGDLAGAIADYSELIRTDPADGLALRCRADIYIEQGDLDKAIADCGTAIALDSHNGEAYCKRATAYAQRAAKSHAAADFARAAADYTEAIRLAKQDRASDLHLGFLFEDRGALYVRSGEAAKAKADFATAQKLGLTVTDEEMQAQPPKAAPPVTRNLAPGRAVFGPQSIGLGNDGQLRVDYVSSGCFHHRQARFVFAGASPNTTRPTRFSAAVPLNQNDWRRLGKLLTAYRSGNELGYCTTTNQVALLWSDQGKRLRREQFVDVTHRSGLLDELQRRADSRPREAAAATFTTTTYAVGDIVPRRDAAGKTPDKVAPLVGLIYELVEPDSWVPGAGGEIEVAAAGAPLQLAVRQTAEGHRQIVRLLAFLRQALRDTATAAPDVCCEDPATCQTMEALARKVNLNVDKKPLGAVVEQLRTQYKLNVRLAEADDAQLPVTLFVSDLSLRSVLALMLAGHDLTCTIDGGGLLITGPNSPIDAKPMLCGYRVNDLIGAEPGRATPAELRETVGQICATRFEVGGAAAECIPLGHAQLLVVDAPFAGQTDVAAALHRLRTIVRHARSGCGASRPVRLYASADEQAAPEAVGKALREEGEPDWPLVAFVPPVSDCVALRAVVAAALGKDWGSFSADGYAGCVSLGKLRALVVRDTEEVDAEVAKLLALLETLARDTAAGHPATCYRGDFSAASDDVAVARALAQKVTLDIDQQPLTAVLANLKQSYGLNAVLDKPDVVDGRLDAERPVTIHVKDVPLRAALKQMLRPLRCGWFSDETGLTIYSWRDGEDFLTTAFYPVNDLVGGDEGQPGRYGDLATLVETIQVETVSAEITARDWHSQQPDRAMVGISFGPAKLLAVVQPDHVQAAVAAWLARTRKTADHAAGSEARTPTPTPPAGR